MQTLTGKHHPHPTPEMAAQLLFLVSSVATSLLLTANVQCVSADQLFQPQSRSVMNHRYVTPSRNGLPCNGSAELPCLTLEEYASDPGAYFTSDTIFYFYSGNHQLNTSLELRNVNNLHFQAMNSGNISVTISFNELVGITWINCTDISLDSINFFVTENFLTHLLLFENTSAISLSNIAITSDTDKV